MGKIIFWVLLALLAWWLIKRPSKTPPDSTGNPPGEAGQEGPERVVKCSTCGVFMPESDSVSTDGKIGCRDPRQCGHLHRS